MNRTLAARGSLLLVVVALLTIPCLAPACATAPPTASPAGTTAFYQDRVYKALGAIRDTAVAANDATPPLLERNQMRAVVQWEDAAIVTIHAAKTSADWKPVVLTGMDEVIKTLAPDEQRLLSPYVALVKILMQEIP